jgi:hypothetical protein
MLPITNCDVTNDNENNQQRESKAGLPRGPGGVEMRALYQEPRFWRTKQKGASDSAELVRS